MEWQIDKLKKTSERAHNPVDGWKVADLVVQVE